MAVNNQVFNSLFTLPQTSGLQVILNPKSYSWPESIPLSYRPKKKPKVVIDVDEFRTAVAHGATWEQLEKFYMVDVETLKHNFFIDYERSKAHLEVEVLDAMVRSAVTGDNQMLKWLSNNWLGFSNKVDVIQTSEQTPDEDTINKRLQAILDKVKNKE